MAEDDFLELETELRGIYHVSGRLPVPRDLSCHLPEAHAVIHSTTNFRLLQLHATASNQLSTPCISSPFFISLVGNPFVALTRTSIRYGFHHEIPTRAAARLPG